MNDVRFALRILRKNPGFTAAAVLTLALGIGSTTTVFSVVHGVLMRPLPFHDPDHIVRLEEKWLPRFTRFEATPGHVQEWKRNNRSFSEIAAFANAGYNLTGSDTPERLQGARVNANVLSVLGVQPMIGRAFTPEEDQPERNQVVLLGEGLWKRRFGGDPGIVGRQIMLSGVSCTVVGIMPAGFDFPQDVEIWRPIAFTPQDLSGDSHFVWAVARLNAGITPAQAQSDLDSILSASKSVWSARVVPLQDHYVGDVRRPLQVLFGAVLFVLLIAGVNVANLLLARSSARQKEIALRISIGASRRRIVRQLLTESLVLALIGGALGIAVSIAGVGALRSMTSIAIPRVEEVSLDPAVLAFSFAVSVLTALTIGLTPALRFSRADLRRASNRWSGLLVVSELAFALVLMVGAGLLAKSFVRLIEVDPGFNTRNVFTAEITLPALKYPQPAQRVQFVNRLLEQLKSDPRVEIVAASSHIPLSSGKRDSGFRIDGRDANGPDAGGAAQYFGVTPAFARALGLSVVAGRFIEESDAGSGKPVVLVNEAFVKRFFLNQDPIGQRIDISSTNFMREIVGVVRDVKRDSLDVAVPSQVFEPFWQNPSGVINVVLRTSDSSMPIAAELRRQVLTIDQEVPIAKFRSMDEVVSGSLASRRFSVVVLGVFTGLAVILAFVGIYGVMSTIVSQRTPEFGIRIALGAPRNAIIWLITAQGLRLVVAGVVLGLLASFGLTRFLQSLLYNVTPTDATVIAVVSLAITTVALAAALIPALRASRIAPLSALRSE